MPALQELSIAQIQEALSVAADRKLPLTVTVQSGETWTNRHSRALLIRDDNFWIEYPTLEGCEPQEFVKGQQVTVNFKLRHYKHIFTTMIVAIEQTPLDGEVNVPALGVGCPLRMQRLQRRAFSRVDVPPNRIVRAAFWLGGRQAEPRGTSPSTPVWSGRVTNISAGGFQVLMPAPVAECAEIGDTVGVRLAFGTSSGEAVFADAQLRHVRVDGEWTNMGFQFVGLTQAPDGERTLQMISVKVAEFQRFTQTQAPPQRAVQVR